MALSDSTVHEYRTTGSNTNSGGFVWTSLVNSTYKWTASGSGTNEYYVELAGGGDPGLTEAKDVYLDGKHNKATNGTLGSLSASEWDWGDNDTLGYSTVYVRLANGLDPDAMGLDYVGMGKGGGVDYSQQTSAQASFTNLSTDVAGTQLTDADAGGLFTALMIGNLIYIASGTGFTVGWYEILTFIDSDNVTIDRSAGSSATAGAGKVGGARALPTGASGEANEPGNTTYLLSGTYTLTGNVIVAKDGLSNKHIKYEGYNTTRGDNPTGTNRPLVACGAFSMYFDNYYSLHNIRATGTAASVLGADFEATFFNCKSENTSGTSNRDAFTVSGFAGVNFVACEGVSTNGYAINAASANCYGGYVHDSNVGYHLGTANALSASLQNCVIDTCTTGILEDGCRDTNILNCTIYNCTSGVSSTGQRNIVILNNIIDSCTTGLSFTNATINSGLIDYNNYTNNTTDVVNVQKGSNFTTLAPEFTDAANGDFTVGDNMKAGAYTGDANYSFTNYIDLGAVQTEESSAEPAYGFFS